MARKWTAEKVLEAIRQRQQRGLPLKGVCREEPNFYAAARRYHGGWRKALVAAGMKVPSFERWTKEKVLESLRILHQQGVLPAEVSNVDCRLYGAARRYLGSWAQAVQQAFGLDYPSPKKWSKDIVIEAIRLRHAQGLPLKNMPRFDIALYRAARYRFGGWAAALAAAGLDSKPFRRWSQERLVQALRDYYRTPSDLHCKKGHALLTASYRYFSSLPAARAAAGIEIPVRKWSPQRVIEALQDRHIRGLPIETAHWRENLSLANGAQKYFGSWENALVAAGLLLDAERPQPKRHWTRAGVLVAIRKRQQQGLPLRGVRNQDGGLFFAAAKQFGGWHKALLAAGLESHPRRRWTKAKIIAAIRARVQQDLPLTNIQKPDAALGAAARRHFGGWRKALRGRIEHHSPEPNSRSQENAQKP